MIDWDFGIRDTNNYMDMELPWGSRAKIPHTPCRGLWVSTLEMATHSSILAWRIPWMEEPGGLQSMGLQRVGHN